MKDFYIPLVGAEGACPHLFALPHDRRPIDWCEADDRPYPLPLILPICNYQSSGCRYRRFLRPDELSRTTLPMCIAWDAAFAGQGRKQATWKRRMIPEWPGHPPDRMQATPDAGEIVSFVAALLLPRSVCDQALRVAGRGGSKAAQAALVKMLIGKRNDGQLTSAPPYICKREGIRIWRVDSQWPHQGEPLIVMSLPNFVKRAFSNPVTQIQLDL